MASEKTRAARFIETAVAIDLDVYLIGFRLIFSTASSVYQDRCRSTVVVFSVKLLLSIYQRFSFFPHAVK